MTTVIAYLILLNLINNILFKRAPGIFCCGLFGFSGNSKMSFEQGRISLNKIKILGLLSYTSRGKDACGLYINKSIIRGFNNLETKNNLTEWDDFLMDSDNVIPDLDLTKGNVIIGHVRAASSGTARTESTTHPFWIKNEDESNQMVIAHNGSLENQWEMCKKYDVDHVKLHLNIDSKALGYLLNTVGTSILEEYKGSAALLWTNPLKPNSLWVYHGASLRSRSDSTMTEERPLYYLKAEEGLYFASEARFLNAIRESSKQEVVEVAFNRVLKVTNGKFTNEVVEINRKEVNLPQIWKQSEISVSQQNARIARTHGTSGFAGHTQQGSLHLIRETTERKARVEKLRAERGGAFEPTPSTSLVWMEEAPTPTLGKTGKDYISFYQGRYHHPAGNLAHNLLWIKDRGIVEEDSKDAKAFWFWRGVMLKDERAYIAIVNESNVANSWVNSNLGNYAYYMSRHSKFPVCNMDSESIDESPYFRFAWYFNQKRVQKLDLTPMFSGRTYLITNGFCTKISNSKQSEETFSKEAEDLSVYDIIYSNLEDLHMSLSNIEMTAMENFVYDTLLQEWQMKPLLAEVQGHMWSQIRQGLEAGETLRKILKDDTKVLDKYLEALEKEQEEAETTNSELGDDLPFTIDSYKKYASYSSKITKDELENLPWDVQPTVVPASNFHEDRDDSSVHGFQEFQGEPDPEDAHYIDYIEAMAESAENEMEKYELTRAQAYQSQAHEEAVRKVDEVIDVVSEICTASEELGSMVHSVYATSAGAVVKTSMEDLKHKLAEVCEVNKDPEAILRLNQIVNS